MIQPQELFNIKKGYHHASAAAAFDDTGNKDEWQREVYELALECMQHNNFHSILDVGCGSAYKLVKMPGNYETTGIEVEPTYSWLCKKYPGKKWLLFDNTDPSTLQTDLVICADVIEHIANPDDLLHFLDAIQWRTLIISTPERDTVAGKKDYGPPRNTSHYREWNAKEFRNYISSSFNITDQRIFSGQSATQVCICKK